jgi:hypothetical protein
MGWCLESRESKEGVNRRETQITTANAYAVVLLQFIQESHDQGSIDLLEGQA